MRQRRAQPADDNDAPPLPPHGSAPTAKPAEIPRMACPGCSTPVPTTELAQFGNRCSACYAAFCQADQRTRHPLPDKRTGGNLAWADAILERHKQGQSITPVQLQMAKDALAFRFRPYEPDD